jgi:hypothetical protein
MCGDPDDRANGLELGMKDGTVTSGFGVRAERNEQQPSEETTHATDTERVE